MKLLRKPFSKFSQFLSLKPFPGLQFSLNKLIHDAFIVSELFPWAELFTWCTVVDPPWLQICGVKFLLECLSRIRGIGCRTPHHLFLVLEFRWIQLHLVNFQNSWQVLKVCLELRQHLVTYQMQLVGSHHYGCLTFSLYEKRKSCSESL